jgi:predicted signal transduction protein with EAL and GGDEF domain
MDLDVREQVEMQNDLRQAIERRQLLLYYQPKIHGASGQVTGVEALIRWDHPVRGLISPEVFIPVAERFGLIGSVGNWVIEDACRQIRQWLDLGLRMRVAVNLSMHQLRQDDLVPRISRALEVIVDPNLDVRDHRIGGDGRHRQRCVRSGTLRGSGHRCRSTISAPATRVWPICASFRRAS